MFGFRQPEMIFNLTEPVVTGCLQIADGPGYRIIIGDGVHSIMEDGTMMVPSDGTGYQVMNGLLHGLAGGVLRVITDGAHWDQPTLKADMKTIAALLKDTCL